VGKRGRERERKAVREGGRGEGDRGGEGKRGRERRESAGDEGGRRGGEGEKGRGERGRGEEKGDGGRGGGGRTFSMLGRSPSRSPICVCCNVL